MIFDKLIEFFRKASPDTMKRLEDAIRKAQMPYKVRVFYSDANAELGDKICALLKIPRGERIHEWDNHETRVKLAETVKGCVCFIIGSYHNNANVRHMEICAAIRACKALGAIEVIAVLPFLGYMKQEKVKDGREAILSKLICEQICQAGANRVVVVDFHADAIQGFFDVPVDRMKSMKVLSSAIKKDLKNNSKRAVVVSPDAGGVARARKFMDRLRCYLAIIFKYRPTPETADATVFLGDVKGKIAIIVDDLVQSINTLVESVIKLHEKDAEEVWICIIHGDWCGNAVANMRLLMLSGAVERFYITDTTPLPEGIKDLPGVRVVSVAPLLAETIKRIYMGHPLSPLYEMNHKKPSVKNNDKKKLTVAERLRIVMKEHHGIDIDIEKIVA